MPPLRKCEWIKMKNITKYKRKRLIWQPCFVCVFLCVYFSYRRIRKGITHSACRSKASLSGFILFYANADAGGQHSKRRLTFSPTPKLSQLNNNNKNNNQSGRARDRESFRMPRERGECVLTLTTNKQTWWAATMAQSSLVGQCWTWPKRERENERARLNEWLAADGRQKTKTKTKEKMQSHACCCCCCCDCVWVARADRVCSRRSEGGGEGGRGVARACSIANSNLAGSSSNSSRQVDQLWIWHGRTTTNHLAWLELAKRKRKTRIRLTRRQQNVLPASSSFSATPTPKKVCVLVYKCVCVCPVATVLACGCCCCSACYYCFCG